MVADAPRAAHACPFRVHVRAYVIVCGYTSLDAVAVYAHHRKLMPPLCPVALNGIARRPLPANALPLAFAWNVFPPLTVALPLVMAKADASVPFAFTFA